MATLTATPTELPMIEVPPEARTHEGFRQWVVAAELPKQVRLSYIGGRIFIDMSPESLGRHNPLKLEVTRVVSTLVRELDLGQFFIDRALVTHEAAELSTEPDAMFATWDTLGTARLRFNPMVSRPDDSKELVGTPDWVLEVVSVSSIKWDKKNLREAYFDAGVVEYWLMDPLGDEVDFQILVRGADGYLAIKPDREGWLGSVVFPREFRVDVGRDRLGRRQFTLRAREPRRV